MLVFVLGGGVDTPDCTPGITLGWSLGNLTQCWGVNRVFCVQV